MRIKKITIDNYKSIKHLEFFPSTGLNAFVGENSVGKSNIFNAINWLLGPVYPSFNSTTKLEHWLGDDKNKICITLEYDDGCKLELNENKIAQKGEVRSGLFYNGQAWNCKGEIREQYCSAYLGIDREIQDYLPSNRWTLVGRILQKINEQFEQEEILNKEGKKVSKTLLFKTQLEAIRDDILFSVGRSTDKKDGLMDKFVEILQTESAKQLNTRESKFSIDLSLYDPWNFYRTLQILVKEDDMDMQFQASTLGMGVQASIMIAVLKAYASLNLKNKTPIFIDEPELFLHPQAQRNFYNVLKEISQDKKDKNGMTIDGLQIFYNTHSANFLKTDRFNEIFVVRKNRERGTYINSANIEDFCKDFKSRTGKESTEDEMFLHFKNAYENTGDSEHANESFFARKVLLVEGQSENLILPYFFDLLNFDYIKEGLTIVRCGNKDELDRFFRLYNEFGIPVFVIFDGDLHHKNTDNEKRTISKNKAILKLFGKESDWADGKVNDRYLGFEKTFNDNLGFISSKKGLDLFVEVKAVIKTQDQIPIWVVTLVKKIEKLNFPLDSVLELKEKDEEDINF